jgi:hypothetical protein
VALLDEYDQTKDAFGAMVKDLLAVTQCSEEWKQLIREAGAVIWNMEWACVRYYDLDRLFLAWLGSPTELWLTNVPAVDHWLPATAMVGVETMKADERKAAMAAREIRVARCAEYLRAGWAPEDAIIFVASREEWTAAGGHRVRAAA